jgi:hypothetical protein
VTISVIHSFLVHPDKAAENPSPIRGTTVTGEGQLVKMLHGIFDRAPTECNFEIAFTPNEAGEQQNECRDALLAFVTHPTKANGLKIAERLQTVTTHRSSLGLLFLILGSDGGKHKRLVLSRFPAENGIVAQEDGASLTVEFIEQIFMKSASAYKSVVYEGKSLEADFWTGRAIDKQINSEITISNYWIRDFLSSDFAVTGARGTRRLAVALREAMNTAEDFGVRQELAAAAQLAANLNGKIISGSSFAEKFHLSAEATDSLRHSLKSDKLFNEQFKFTSDEFAQHVAFRSVELDNGALMTAEATSFNDVFTQQALPKSDKIRFTTSGRVIDDKLRKSKQ